MMYLVCKEDYAWNLAYVHMSIIKSVSLINIYKSVLYKKQLLKNLPLCVMRLSVNASVNSTDKTD